MGNLNNKPKAEVLKADDNGYLHIGKFVIKADHLKGVTKDEFVKSHSKTLRHEIYNVWNAIKPFTKVSKSEKIEK